MNKKTTVASVVNNLSNITPPTSGKAFAFICTVTTPIHDKALNPSNASYLFFIDKLPPIPLVRPNILNSHLKQKCACKRQPASTLLVASFQIQPYITSSNTSP
jgi:hypothetical protein